MYVLKLSAQFHVGRSRLEFLSYFQFSARTIDKICIKGFYKLQSVLFYQRYLDFYNRQTLEPHMLDDFPVVSNCGKLSAQLHVAT